MPETDSTASTQTRVQQAAEILAARWATRVMRTVPASGSARPTEILAEAPMIPSASLYSVCSLLVDNGLLARVSVPGSSRRYGLEITEAGRALAPVHDAALSWAQRHPVSGTAARDVPEMIEDVLGILASPLTAPLLADLSMLESMSFARLMAALPSETHGLIHHRLAALVNQGLATRSGSPRTYRWTISPAGVQMCGVFGVLSAWAKDHLPAALPSHLPGSTLADSGSAPVVLGAGATVRNVVPAAVKPQVLAEHLRSATLRLEFSHAPAPQPAPLLRSAPVLAGVCR